MVDKHAHCGERGGGGVTYYPHTHTGRLLFDMRARAEECGENPDKRLDGSTAFRRPSIHHCQAGFCGAGERSGWRRGGGMVLPASSVMDILKKKRRPLETMGASRFGISCAPFVGKMMRGAGPGAQIDDGEAKPAVTSAAAAARGGEGGGKGEGEGGIFA